MKKWSDPSNCFSFFEANFEFGWINCCFFDKWVRFQHLLVNGSLEG